MSIRPSDHSAQSAIEKAATLLLVRDELSGSGSGSGIQVFMLERPSRGAFPGLHVFTGGKVDATDLSLLSNTSWQGPSSNAAARLLNSDDDPLCYWMAAVRECYEESGVLLGNQSGQPLDPPTVLALSTARAEEFGALCKRLGITLDFAALHYFAHWITPEIAPRRFDTRFFVARLPEGQRASFAPGETVSGEWVTPAEALARAEDGRWNLIMPTLTSLRSLLPYQSVDDLLAFVRKFEHLPDYTEHLRSEGMQPGIDPALREQ